MAISLKKKTEDAPVEEVKKTVTKKTSPVKKEPEAKPQPVVEEEVKSVKPDVPDVKKEKPVAPVKTIGINESNLSKELAGTFGMSEWDTIPVIKSTGFKIIDALLASDKDEMGLTMRTINTLYGGSGIGKSTFWTQVGAKIVSDSEHGQFIYWDAEKTVTTGRLKMLGAPIARTTLIKKDTNIEKFFALLKILATKRHEQMETHGEEFLMKNPYIVVADSISAMSTNKETEVDTDINKAMGVPAKMWSIMLKTYMDVLFKYNITVLFVNQVRDKISLTPGGMKKSLVYEKADESCAGGKAIPFYSFTYCRLGYKGQIKEDQYGFQAVEVEFNLIKSKNSETNRAISAVFIPSKGYSDFWTSLFYLKDNGYVKTGAFYKFSDKDGLDKIYPRTWRLRASEETYNSDPDFRKAFDYAVQKASEEIIGGAADGEVLEPEICTAVEDDDV